MKTLKQRRCRSGVFIANCEHISLYVLISDVERVNLSWVHIEKTNRQKDMIYQAQLCIILSVNKFPSTQYLNLYQHSPTGKSVKNSCERVYFTL